MTVSIKQANSVFGFLIVLAVIIAAFFAALEKNHSTVDTAGEGSFVLIIDPGHGGADGGAVSKNGHPESEINLEISKKMFALAQLTATKCVMTRESEDIVYPDDANSINRMKVYDQNKRVEFIESITGGILLSVHQNKFPSAQPRGPQAFYAKDERSPILAALVQENMNSALYPQNRRVAAPISNNIYLFKNISCPAVLAECGFLSHPEEADLLETDSYQLKTALALMTAYFRFTGTQTNLS